MPRISSKGMAMPESPIRKLVPFAEDAERQGKKIYYLNIGQPDIKTPDVALQAVKEYNTDVLSYSHSAGNESLRAGLAHYYRQHQIDVSTSDIIVSTGGSEALMFAFGAIMDAGDEIIIPEPFYANYNGFAVANAVTVVPVESTILDGFALPSIDEFEKLITEKTRAVLICNPGNPTGYLYTKKELQQLCDLALKHDIFIIADEVYREFVYDGVQHTSIMSFPGMDQHAIMIDSISKRYSMCGARIGMLVTRNLSVMQTALKFAQARLSPPTYAQIAAEAALETPESYFREVNEEYVQRRNILVDGLNSIEGVFCPKPQGAFYCMASLPVDDTDRFAHWLLQSFDYNNQTVMIAPASGFYFKQELGTHQARFAYVLNRESLERSIEIIRQALAVYPGSSV